LALSDCSASLAIALQSQYLVRLGELDILDYVATRKYGPIQLLLNVVESTFECCREHFLDAYNRKMSETIPEKIPETMHDTLGNGGIMYRVFNNAEKKELRVITPDPLPENNILNFHDEDSELNDWVNPTQFKPSEILIPYKRVWIAQDSEYRKDGYEILAEISCYEDICSYVFIGPTVTFFWTSQPIEIYHSYVGNSGVPYGFGVTKDYVYSFFSYSDEGEVIIAVSRKRIEKSLYKKTGKSLNDNLTNEDLWEVTDEITDLPFATVKQETLHDNISAEEYEPFDQGRFQEIIKKTNLLPRRRTNYGNTRVALASRVPMNIAHHIAEFRTGLAYRPYKKNTMRNSGSNNIKPLGALPNNFHEENSANNGSNHANNNGSNHAINHAINRGNKGTVPTTKTKCSKGKCAIMGGRRTRKRTYKRRNNRRNTRR
jgi:hypothetical protein